MKQSNILIVDDEKVLASTIAEILSLEGYTTNYCESPLEALKLKDTKSFDLVISDIAMPDITGIEMMERWGSENNIQKPPPVIYVTGHIDTKLPKIENVEIIGVLFKPVSMDELLRLISETAPFKCS